MCEEFRAKRKAFARSNKFLEKQFKEIARKCNNLAFEYSDLWNLDRVESSLDWRNCNPIVNPENYMNPLRARRKQQQLGNILCAVEWILQREKISENCVVWDLCSGSGHVGFAIAERFPNMSVRCVELKPSAVEIGQMRSKMFDRRVSVECACILNLNKEDRVDLIVALHACGQLSDIVLDLAMERRACFIICPCCVGKVRVQNISPIQYPRSKEFQKIVKKEEFFVLAKHADHSERDNESSDDEQEDIVEDLKLSTSGPELKDRKFCKTLLESDRLSYACEEYQCMLVKMIPESCTPKSDILIGIPRCKLVE